MFEIITCSNCFVQLGFYIVLILYFGGLGLHYVMRYQFGLSHLIKYLTLP